MNVFYTLIMFLNLLSGHATPGMGISYLGLEITVFQKHPKCSQRAPLPAAVLCRFRDKQPTFCWLVRFGLGGKNLFFGGLVGWLVGCFDLVLETGAWHMAQTGLQLGSLLS